VEKRMTRQEANLILDMVRAGEDIDPYFVDWALFVTERGLTLQE